nr:MAG TPA: hypothetical protein [Caudoviricetes sp.]
MSSAILNNYSIKPRNLAQFTRFRGFTDFSAIGQFNQYEKGYSFLSVLSMPPFMTELDKGSGLGGITTQFQDMLEYEFKGLDGLPDMTADTYDISDGNNTQRIINNVTYDTAVTVSSEYYERSGGLITKFSEIYLTGIRDRMTKARTYHGLIKEGRMVPSLENEVFTMLYYVTDSTMLRLERAVLLCNCQLTKADLSIYNGQRGTYENAPITIEWNCFPVMSNEVDKAANKLLADINGYKFKGGSDSWNAQDGRFKSTDKTIKVSQLDSSDFKYSIMNENDDSAIKSLANALK